MWRVNHSPFPHSSIPLHFLILSPISHSQATILAQLVPPCQVEKSAMHNLFIKVGFLRKSVKKKAKNGIQ